MAKNTSKEYRIGSVDNRSQFERNGVNYKRDTETGRIMNGKVDGKFKGIAHEPDGRKSGQ